MRPDSQGDLDEDQVYIVSHLPWRVCDKGLLKPLHTVASPEEASDYRPGHVDGAALDGRFNTKPPTVGALALPPNAGSSPTWKNE